MINLISTVLSIGKDDPYFAINFVAIFGFEIFAVALLYKDIRSLRGWFLFAVFLACLFRFCASLYISDI